MAPEVAPLRYPADCCCAAAIMWARGTPSSKAAMAVVKAAGSCIKNLQNGGFQAALTHCHTVIRS